MIKKSVINIVTVFIIFGILQISDYVGNLASAYFSNLAVTYIVYTFVHIGVALLMGIVYAKLVLKMSLKDIGMWTRFPERIWWGMGIGIRPYTGTSLLRKTIFSLAEPLELRQLCQQSLSILEQYLL